MRIPHLARLVFALLFAACLVAPALAEDEQEPTDVARQLLLEGRHEEAAAALEKHRGHGHMEPVELAVLDGLIAQQRESHAEAVWQFRHALDLQPERVSVHLYLAQSLFALDQLEACYEHLRAGEGAGENLPAYFVLRARVEQDLGHEHRAYHTARRGVELHPTATLLLREQALVLIRLGLTEAARGPASRYLEVRPDDRGGWLLLAEALRAAGGLDQANLLLEEAMLRFPTDVEIVSRLAYGFALAEQPASAVRLFLRAQALEPRFSFEIAEQLRVGGHHRRALHFNALVDDSRQKLTQRLAIYMGMERYDLAASLLPLFESQPWLEDGLRYQLAYACYATGRGEQLAMLANAIEDEWLSEGVVELMEALERP